MQTTSTRGAKVNADPGTEKWTTQLRKGVLELCVLNAMDGSRLYGYELVKKLATLQGPGIREGTIYPILSRLRREGLAATTIQESPEGPPRKYYELTKLGRHKLKSMNEAWDRLHRSIQSIRRRTKS